MEILPASLRDLPALRRLEQACFQQDAWPLLDLIAVLTWSGVVRLKAVEDEQMVGFVAGDLRPGETTAWIATIGVLPAYQRRGIGRALLRACEDQLQGQRIRLCVRTSNRPAIQMYLRAGYASVDTWRRYYKDGEDALVMEKVRPAGL
ncbi:MAG: GNAT family N-acetyltransferase [Anaerolineales bacterium]